MTPPTADRFAKPRSIACEDATTQLFLHVRECKDVATGAPESFELQAQMIATGSAAQCAAHAIDCVGAVARAAKCAHALGDAKLAIPDARGDDAACDAVRDVCGDDDYSLAQYATCYGALGKVGSGRGERSEARCRLLRHAAVSFGSSDISVFYPSPTAAPPRAVVP